MREAVRAFGLLPVEQDVYEADDLIATYARQAREAGADVLIVSADKDLMQLVRPGVAMYDPASGDARRARASGLSAGSASRRSSSISASCLTGSPMCRRSHGDATDNVPGAPGIGIKTAAQLIGEYGDLDTLLARASEIKQPKRRETLTNPEIVEKIRISHKLVTLVDDVAVETPLSHLTLGQPDPVRLVAFLKAMEFTTITKRVGEAYEADVAAIDADEALAPGGSRAAELKALYASLDAGGAQPSLSEAASAAVSQPAKASEGDGWLRPADLAASRKNAALAAKIDLTAYECVRDLDALKRWIALAYEAGAIAIDTETSAIDPMQADLVGVSMAVAPGRACYIPLQHRGGTDLFGGGMVEGQIALTEALAALKPLLADPGVLKIGQNLKYDLVLLKRYGLDVVSIDDTMLISYALDAGNNTHGMDRLSELHLGHETITFGQVAGTGKAQVTFDKVALDKATDYAAEDADVTLRLWNVLKPRLVAEGRTTVYETLERPLIDVLARMEARGISIDRQILSRLSGEFAQSLARLEDEIHEIAGEKFTIGSPKQLGDILFGKMGLAGAKKTATGQWATGAGVLEELAEQGHPLPSKILEWRQLSKLKSTYTDSLPAYVNPQTQRVHTSFALAATTTGRLSSSEPNLQNIPIRTEAGRKIRTAFIPEKGYKLVSADYSQIELRLLAHIAEIPQLRQAFADGIDIHAMTASEMFGVPVQGMPSEVRRRAKAINFGIIYGISAFGLANQLGIGREEASAYIRKYFERFPGIRDYMDQTKIFVRANGHVETIFGRICHFPAVASKNPSERAFVERQAINAPIQGSAADIIRRAMIRMEDALAAARLDVRMLLQVHDELVFEVPDGQVEAALPVITRVMVEAPHPAVQLRVPLQVDARAAGNWDEAH